MVKKSMLRRAEAERSIENAAQRNGIALMGIGKVKRVNAMAKDREVRVKHRPEEAKLCFLQSGYGKE